MNLLINPAGLAVQRYAPVPLGLLYIAAMDEETVIYDDALRSSEGLAGIAKLNPRVVGVPFYTPGRHNSLGYLRRAKECGAVTVAGGPHISVMLKQMVAHYSDAIDYFVVGDGELAWKAICEGQDLPQVIRMRIEDLDAMPLPAWEKVDFTRYSARVNRDHSVHRGNDLTTLPRVSIVLSRGCTGRCDFCSAWWVNGKPRAHGAGWMMAHLERLWSIGVRHLDFQDDCLTHDRKAVMELCDILEPYSFSWIGCTRADKVDEEMAQRMADTGCYLLAFGIESGSPTILQRMRKEIALGQVLEGREACRKAGIHFTALMIKNYPGSTPETNRETAEFLKRLQPDGYGGVGATWVLPGTTLYQQCKRAGLIDDDFWLGPEPYYVYQGGL